MVCIKLLAQKSALFKIITIDTGWYIVLLGSQLFGSKYIQSVKKIIFCIKFGNI